MSHSVLFVSHKHVSAVTRVTITTRALARGAIFAPALAMAAPTTSVSSLRAEARLLAIAGVLLLLVGFPLTMSLALMALSPEGVSPVLPIAIGAPPLVLGYLACHFASKRMERAKALEGEQPRSAIGSR